ncbi:MAG: lytic murein transglycosylase [Pseudomonadota bacterium]
MSKPFCKPLERLARCTAMVLGASILVGSLAAPSPVSAQSKRSGEPGVIGTSNPAGFRAWIRSFEGEARRAGIPRSIYQQAFADVRLNNAVLERDARQPEFATPIWDYLGLLVSDTRIGNGRRALAQYRGLLDRISERYGVPPEIVTAIWGIESNYGVNRGSFGVIEALASLGYEGRRDKWARGQLIDALKVLKNGDTTSDRMIGSWAGAMGHTQFIPSSYQSHAVDFDGDGRRDIWADDPTDALASTANYLFANGWRTGEPWGYHVMLPPNFNYALVQGGRLPLSEWAAMGVRLADSTDLPMQYNDAELILPAGASGPALLTLNNFRTILRYNNATSYALAVSLLAEQISGQPPRKFRWPNGVRSLSRTDVKELQGLLTQLGFDTGGIDGLLGRNSRSAIRDFQRSRGLVPDGFPSDKLLDQVRQAVAIKDAPISLGRSTSATAVEPDQADAGPASRADIREMQVLLTGLGFDTKGIDGRIGRNTRAAIFAFERNAGLSARGQPSVELLTALRRVARGE